MIYRASWLLPIVSQPVRDTWVEVDGGWIVQVGSGRAPEAMDLEERVILPALVNAHTHLELSHLHGVVPPAGRLVDWIRPLLEARRTGPPASAPSSLDAARQALASARASGTGLVGDVANSLAPVAIFREAGVPAHVFQELLGFADRDGRGRVREARARVSALGDDGSVRVSLAPHAPYSVSPELFGAIAEDLDAHAEAISSVHLAESPEELEFIAAGTGPWRELLEEMGAWTAAWRPHGGSPVDYLVDLGFLDRRVLAVHGVQCTGDDLVRLRSLGVTLVSCPRSNRYVGVGSPPLEPFYAMGVSVAFGTDSLASVGDLNMFSELAEARRIAPRVPARALLRSATLGGAQALGRADEFGSIEPGKRSALIAVRVPGEIADVEEYLVSGITADAVTWL